MLGEEFYQKFKNALEAVGAAWGQKDSVVVRIRGEYLVFNCPATNTEHAFKIPCSAGGSGV